MLHRSNQVDGRSGVVAEIVAAILEQGTVVTPLDVLLHLEVTDPERVALWRSGGIPYLERAMTVGLSRVAGLLEVLHSHALSLGLKPVQGAYRHGKRRLRFSKRGDAVSERVYTTHFVRAKPSAPMATPEQTVKE